MIRFYQYSPQRFDYFTNFQQCVTVFVFLHFYQCKIILIFFFASLWWSKKREILFFHMLWIIYSFMNHLLHPLTIFYWTLSFPYWLEKSLYTFWILILYFVYMLQIFSVTCLLFLFLVKKNFLVILICYLQVNF